MSIVTVWVEPGVTMDIADGMVGRTKATLPRASSPGSPQTLARRFANQFSRGKFVT